MTPREPSVNTKTRRLFFSATGFRSELLLWICAVVWCGVLLLFIATAH
jgi:hypothetical protein